MTIERPDPADGKASEELEDILGVTVSLALERAGWTAVLGTSGVPPDDTSEFRLSVRYSLYGGRVVLTFQLEDTRERVPSETRDLERDLDPQFDAAVGRVVADLARSMDEALAALPVPEPPAERPPEPPAREIAEAPASAEPRAAREPEPRPRGASGLRLGGGALIPLGEAGDYFRVAPWLEVSWLSSPGVAGRGRVVMSLGGTMATFDWGNGPSAEAAILQAGIGAAYSAIRTTPLGLNFEIKAGPAFVGMWGVEAPSVIKILPFLQTGVKVGYRPFPRWEFGLSMSGAMFLDYGVEFFPLRLIWGLVPAVAVSRELR